MKKSFISLMILITIMLLTTNVFAATTGNVILTVDTNEIKAGDEITVLLRASDSNKLNTIEYSKITITNETGKETQAITVKSVETIGSWAKFEYDGKQAFVYSGSATDSAEVFEINLTVSDDIEQGKYNINVNDLTVYSTNLADDTTTIGNKFVTVEFKAEESKDDDMEDDTENNTGNNIDKNENNNKVDNSISDGNKLPQTGVGNIIVITILSLAIISRVFYVSYKNYKDI